MNARKLFLSALIASLLAYGQSGTALSLDTIKTLLAAIGDGQSTEAELIGSIRTRGVGFPWTPENQTALIGFGAKQPVLDAIQRVAPRPPGGTLIIRCSPGNCNVRINQQPEETSQNGRFTKDGVPLGPTTVILSKEGYVSQQLRPTIVRDPAVDLAVTLEPTEQTKVSNGQTLFQLTLSALGLEGNAAKLASLDGTGSATTYNGGKQLDFHFDLQARAPNSLAMKVTNTKEESFQLNCEGETCKEQGQGWASKIPKMGKGGKKLPNEVQQDVTTNLRRLSRYALPGLIKTLRSPGVQFSAQSAESAAAKEQHLIADVVDGVYDITLGADLLPGNVTYKPGSGLGAPTRIIFAAYMDIGNGARYPTRTSVRANDDGIEVRLETIKAVKP
jgi:hypothetical protein